MSRYNAIKTATNAYIRGNGRQEITGNILNAVLIATIDSLGRFFQFVGVADPADDPGTPDQNVIYITGTAGTYTNFGGIVVGQGEMALILWDGTWRKQLIKIVPESTSQLDNDSGFVTNAVNDLLNYYLKTETYTKDQVDAMIAAVHQFEFVVAAQLPTASASTMYKIYLVPASDPETQNTKDEYVTIEQGGAYSWEKIGSTAVDLSDYPTNAQMAQAIDDALTAYIANVTATVDANVGTPSVDVTYNQGVLTLAFHNLKGGQGEQGIQGPPGVTTAVASVDNNTGIPSVEASVNNGVLTLTFHNLKGAQGDTGSSVDYPFTLVNNTTTDDPLQALTAAMGKYLQDQVSQLEAKVTNISVVNESPGDEETIEFQEDGGGFIASVSPSGIKSKSYVVKKGADEYAIDEMAVTDGNGADLAIGDNNGKDIVVFENGHIKTKFFNSEQIERRADTMEDEIEQLQEQGSQSLSALRKHFLLEDFYSYRKGKSGNSWYNRFCLMHFSDTHINLTNLAEALNLSKGMVDAVVDTGDNANGMPEISASTTIGQLSQYKTTATPIELTAPLAICAGNHDVPNLTKKEYFDVMCDLVSDKSQGFVFGDSAHYRSYGYFDITPNPTIGTIRLIVLDPFDYEDGQFMNPYGQTGIGSWMNCVFSQAQINWLIATFRSAASNGYKVITAMHYSFGDSHTWGGESANPDANYHQDPFMIPDIIDAMQNKTTLSKSYPDDENINNIVINEDFSGINDFHYICHLFGHIHSENEYQCQKTDGSKFYDMLMIGAPNMGSEGYAINKVPLQPGTINSIKLTFLEIDTLEQAVYRVNYGAYKAYDFSSTERSKRIAYRFNNA